jgi:hypothetical protein
MFLCSYQFFEIEAALKHLPRPEAVARLTFAGRRGRIDCTRA